MKILQLCIRVPFPASDGATIAMYNITRSFIDNGSEVKVLSFNTNKNFIAEDRIPPEMKKLTGIETVNLDLTVRPLPAFLNMFKGDSYNISRFISAEFEQKLKNILSKNDYDVVHLEGLYVSPYVDLVRKLSKAKIVLRSHNVEYVIWERLASSATNPLKKKYLNFLARRLKKYELGMMNRFDAIVPITPVDEIILRKDGCTVPVKVIPLGVDTKTYPVNENVSMPFSIFHLGSMDWMPNLDAVNWFLCYVYEKLVAKSPDIKIILAGKDMPQQIKDMASENLIVLDRIQDAKQFMLDKHAMFVPLLSGGGMRVKIIEGMAAGKAIVSTSVGAEGINYTNGKNILIADSPGDFCDAVLKLKNDETLCKSLGSNARKLVEKEYDNKVLGTELLSFYNSLIDQG